MQPFKCEPSKPRTIIDRHTQSHTHSTRLAPFVIENCVPERHRRTIEQTCKRTDMRVLAAGMRFSFDAKLKRTFRVDANGAAVTLCRRGLANLAISALSMRHALELALWQRHAGPVVHSGTNLAIAIIALRVTTLYFLSQAPRERDACLPDLPRWMQQAIESLEHGHSFTLDALAASSTAARKLLPLQGISVGTAGGACIDAATQAAARAVFAQAGHLAAPVDHLVIGSGDARLAVDPAGGPELNGCTAGSRTGPFTFSFSSASSISDATYDEAERLRHTFIAAALAGRSELTELKA